MISLFLVFRFHGRQSFPHRFPVLLVSHAIPFIFGFTDLHGSFPLADQFVHNGRKEIFTFQRVFIKPLLKEDRETFLQLLQKSGDHGVLPAVRHLLHLPRQLRLRAEDQGRRQDFPDRLHLLRGQQERQGRALQPEGILIHILKDPSPRRMTGHRYAVIPGRGRIILWLLMRT